MAFRFTVDGVIKTQATGAFYAYGLFVVCEAAITTRHGGINALIHSVDTVMATALLDRKSHKNATGTSQRLSYFELENRQVV